jgi:superfamily II DNA or RNA helicase
MRLLFDHGTIVLTEPPDLDLGFLPGVIWDPRVALYRAPARFHAEIVRELERRRLPFADEVQSPAPRRDSPAQAEPWRPIELRPYQTAALFAWDLAERRGIAVLPTGSGKTRLALAALAKARVPALCLVPTRILLRQWREELERVYTGSVGCLGDGERTIADICVATFESAYRYMPKLGRRFEMVVIDEVHHFGTGMRDEALEMSTARFRLGLTATPPPDTTAERLEELVGPTVYQLGVGDLAGRWLADLDRIVLRLPLDPRECEAHRENSRAFNCVYRAFRRSHPTATWQEFSAIAQSSLEGREALAAWRRNRKLLGLTSAKRAAVAELLGRHHGSRVLVFTSDNEAAYAIARERLVMPITCDISRSERADALAAFRTGDLRVLVSSRVLNEGIDVPDADVAVIVGGGSSEREYVQRVGRLLRPRPGKRALVYELITAGTTEARDAARRRRGLGAQGSSLQSL